MKPHAAAGGPSPSDGPVPVSTLHDDGGGYAPGYDPHTLTSAPHTGFPYNTTPGAVITGGTRLGDVLTGNDSVPWSDPYGSGLSQERRYQWLRDSVPIPGATALTYTITAEDQGTALVLRTIAARHQASSRQVAIPVAADLKALETATKPVLAGDAVAGTPMTVKAGTWSVPSDKLTVNYTWFFADGKTAAQGTTFTPGEEHLGKMLNVLVTASAPAYRKAWAHLNQTGHPPCPGPDTGTGHCGEPCRRKDNHNHRRGMVRRLSEAEDDLSVAA